jgi:outer membrane protein assembly factor BamB
MRIMANNPAGAVLNFPASNGWATISGNWSTAVSTDAATFEIWIKTTSPDNQTIVLGSDTPGATPRISVSQDRLSVYWSTSGSGPGWTSADTTPVTDGQWHHIAVVFDQGAITFYKDGIATADQLRVDSRQQAAGTLQLGAGFGSTTGFIGQLYDARVWSVTRTAQQVSTGRWTAPTGPEAGLTAATSFNATTGVITDLVGGGTSTPVNASITTTDLPFPTFVLSLAGGDDSVMAVLGHLPSDLTLECWLRMSTAAGVAAASQSLMGVGNPRPVLTFDYLGDDLLGVTFGTQHFASVDTRVISDGAWHHVALVVSNGVVTLYKDGVATTDTIQIPNPPASLGDEVSVGSVAGASGFNGQLHQIRAWGAARTTAQISGFRYVPLDGPETGLYLLVGFEGSGSADPDGQRIVNLMQGGGALPRSGNPAGAIPAQLPQQPLPANVWTFPTSDESPVAPSLSPQGVLCVDNGGGDGYLRCLDMETKQVSWSYNSTEYSDWTASVVPQAIGLSGQTAYLAVKEVPPGDPSDLIRSQLHAVNVNTGANVWVTDLVFDYDVQLLTRPVVLGGAVFAGYASASGTELAWGPAGVEKPTLVAFTISAGAADFMTVPVTDGTNVYVATSQGTSSLIIAIPAAQPAPAQPAWHVTPPAAVTADLVRNSGTVFVPAGGTILALNTADGTTLWSHKLSGSPVKSRPVVLGSTLYVGSTDGVLYALDTATGAEQWRVDTGSAITTDLVNENGILYLANAGSGTPAGPAPAFLAVDTNSLGNDALTYPVPGADTILLDQAGVTNGVAYFYGSQNVYAVNMANVLHEFSVNSKLIVEDYDTSSPTDQPQPAVGNNTSYRVTLTIVDQNGFPRVSQAVKLWSAGDLYVINQGTTVTLTPDQPVWMQTDTSGHLTLALSAYDDGSATTGSPNVACPALYAWSNFMPAGESIVIYPDHESLTSLSSVQGTSSNLGQAQAGAPAPITLDVATSYDGHKLILPGYQNEDALANIASAIRNTVGTISPSPVSAGRLQSPRTPRAQRYVKTGVLPNVLHVAVGDPANRPYVPGEIGTFTVDLSNGTPAFHPNTYDPSPPQTSSSGQAVAQGELGLSFDDFVSRVIKGTESVVKMAWQATKDAVSTVIHTVEKDVVTEYDLVISDLKDAITAVTGFMKSVVTELNKVVQWLSALFKWDNILKNHTYIRNSITTGDPNNPTGILDLALTWVNKQLNGGSDIASTLNPLHGQAGAAVGNTAQGTAGHTVQTQQSGNSDPNAVYNYGGNNNANQCTWMTQKVNENAGGGTVGGGAAAALGAASFDPTTILQALETFVGAWESAIGTDLKGLPGQIEQAIKSIAGSFSDPKTILSTALSSLVTVCQDLADDFVKLGQDMAHALLELLASLLEQVVLWLAEPIDIPFVSDLYKLITGEPLSILDLTCLLAAVPGTILLDVLTGSPTVPVNSGMRTGPQLGHGELALADSATPGRVLLGIGALVLSEIGVAMDIFLLGIEVRGSRMPAFLQLVNYLDFAVDFLGYALQMVTAYGWSQWDAKDWTFWALQFPPQALNFAYLFRADGTSEAQAGRDVFFGALYLVLAAVYADQWPATYKNVAGAKTPGLAITVNIFGNVQSISELLQLSDIELMPVEAVVKFVLATVGNITGFAAYVVSLVHD